MLKFNERKVEVLRFLAGGRGVSAKELGEGLGISLPNSKMVLFRLYRQGLVLRVKSPGLWKKPFFKYLISDKGIQRLKFLTNSS